MKEAFHLKRAIVKRNVLSAKSNVEFLKKDLKKLKRLNSEQFSYDGEKFSRRV